MSQITWRQELAETMAANDDPGPATVAPDESVLDVEFDDGWGSVEGPAILAWTADYVYFPACYDGSEWLSSVPRNPRPEGQGHVSLHPAHQHHLDMADEMRRAAKQWREENDR